MASEVDWTSLGGRAAAGGGKARGSKYLKFEKDHVYTIRLVGQAVEFCKFYLPKYRKSVYVEPEDKDAAAKVLERVTGTAIAPTQRFAVNVIDRADGNVKILEGGWSIFKFFANWAKVHSSHPGGKGGFNWTISAEGDGMQRRYTTMPSDAAPFSEDEVAMIKKKGSLFPLKEEFASTPLADLEAKISSLESGDDGNGSKEQQPQAAVAAAAGGGAGGGGDLGDDPDEWF